MYTSGWRWDYITSEKDYSWKVKITMFVINDMCPLQYACFKVGYEAYEGVAVVSYSKS